MSGKFSLHSMKGTSNSTSQNANLESPMQNGVPTSLSQDKPAWIQRKFRALLNGQHPTASRRYSPFWEPQITTGDSSKDTPKLQHHSPSLQKRTSHSNGMKSKKEHYYSTSVENVRPSKANHNRNRCVRFRDRSLHESTR